MINHVTAVIMALNIGILLVIGYMMFWPVKLAVIYNEPFPVFPQEVKRGEEVSFTVDFEKFQNYRVISHRSIVCSDGNLITLTSQSSDSNAPLGRYNPTISITVPDKVSTGTCYIKLENTYFINPLREKHRDMRTQDFTVVE